MLALKLQATGIPDLAVLQDRHLCEGTMHIEGNDLHDWLLSMFKNKGASGPHDNYGSALAAQPGKSKGRPDNNSSSQLMRYFGLPAIRAPNTPIPVGQF
ncbi:hypothetical protein MACH17_42440 [Phaeobacter inhibens]|jgi:hypothetical protein|uniref:Uncharacterized protein n=1 Tax=Profundibacterium mesophilum KAUST100406-0324 TaxID=1037889 RepID=A0A921NYK7_9RHOB|nr:hypothetical protein PMES_00608 [Profundibacterium mesophilum KAUST100406-0324]GLO72727.1 hypothetical protein MACH17_42440 [Phaeobacter inhibens]